MVISNRTREERTKMLTGSASNALSVPQSSFTVRQPISAQSESALPPVHAYEVNIDTTLWNVASTEEKGQLLRAAHDAAMAANPPAGFGDGSSGGGGTREGGGLPDPNVRPQAGPAGAAIGFVTGAAFGGFTYIAAHGLTDGGGQASLGGFLSATFGSGFAGAVGGFSGGYAFMIGGAAIGAVGGVISSWYDHNGGVVHQH